ncbi:2-oxo-4-hydroxy-4-carboxy-5-ureidoimidazoline decarboxylase [Pigmentiphaga sp. GD03639]|uniref:2-oxo-4-hydroxy-4-carboxy-5-ureidoimidazoline decarboxylase n=1 Tax=Pigmentiphaga sp. GD03639 TaxID=2975354 RepID=UPI00244D2414|nr:2-oxo-4-hydroxy-4-carboxy-5-ureidoimidazoline decarboxylase [Pigmentiphaga sp. GD03639]MDH2235914.1 2-oxo-4-hydroxy-4-carboxy-5-ureidoimidazoline decarboxylase [Pigmentiphaga sp. GD03639]
MTSSLTLDVLNTADPVRFVQFLDGLYEHSPWVLERAAARRPFASAAALKYALAQTVRQASRDEQLALIRAHPELAGRAAVAGQLTEDSAGEQARAGLTQCSPEEFELLQQLNAAYNSRFGFPFIIAVRGPTGAGLSRYDIIAALERRLRHAPDQEFAEALRQIDRIAEIRLADRLSLARPYGDAVMDWAETLASYSDSPDHLTCTYLSAAHRAVAARLQSWMLEAGFDSVYQDAAGNVVGRYRAAPTVAEPQLVATGSHYDTVRNGGKYDGRLGVLLPIAVVADLKRRNRRLPFDLDVVAFAEEEGVRYGSTFLGSSAYIGRFDPSVLDALDASDISMREAMQLAGLDPEQLGKAAAEAARLRHYFEIHIEQGPVLLERNLPVGVVTSIAGSVRRLMTLGGVASHAGTTPMDMRRDAACAAAEIVLAVERRCAQVPSLVGTVGILNVPHGSINVIPGACTLSLDLRAADNAVRDAALADIEREISAICSRRGITVTTEELMRAAAAPCAREQMAMWSRAIAERGLPAFELPSGAGHDAMKLAEATSITMLFTRCGNGGISHNPLETMTADDAQLAGELMLDFLEQMAAALSR